LCAFFSNLNWWVQERTTSNSLSTNSSQFLACGWYWWVYLHMPPAICWRGYEVVTILKSAVTIYIRYPPVMVVPSSMVDKDLEKAGHFFRESRPLLWLWGAPGGAALVAMAQISPNIPDTYVNIPLLLSMELLEAICSFFCYCSSLLKHS
jgi:hypothetical protein